MVSGGLVGLDAVILAGGLGTRLRDVVPDLPKAMVDISGRPFLGYLIDWLARWGVARFILCVGYRSRRIKEYISTEKSFAGLEIVFSEETEPQGTGGALGLAAPHLHSDSALVLNGDTFLGVPIQDFVRFHCGNGADVTLAAVWMPDTASFGALEIDSNGRISAFREKAASGSPAYINGGVYLIRQDLARSIRAGCFSLEKDLLPQWLSVHKVLAFPGEFPFLDIGTPERYREAQTFVPAFLQKTHLISGGNR